ncbi:hypothetical protein BHO43_005471 [Escherichia coli]|nr:hypothetical protein [Escherichia coli]EFJ9513575.1 hypothetical protein [Escherichia coli]
MRINDNKKTNQAEYTFNAAIGYFLYSGATGTIGYFLYSGATGTIDYFLYSGAAGTIGYFLYSVATGNMVNDDYYLNVQRQKQH